MTIFSNSHGKHWSRDIQIIRDIQCLIPAMVIFYVINNQNITISREPSKSAEYH